MKVAIVGLGNMGSKIVGPISNADRVSHVVGFDLNHEAGAYARQQHGITIAQSYQAILDDPEVRVVFVTTPNHTHETMALAALKAGKAVMCEKPMATTLEGAELMVQTAEQLGGYLQVGFELRYSHLYVWANNCIRQGLIGQVVNTHCLYVCSEFIGRDSWRSSQDGSGGMFGEKLCHYVDLPRWWIDSPVTEVTSICAPNVVPYYEIRDNYHTTCRHENGAASHLTFMMAIPPTVHHDPLQNHADANRDNGHELRYLIQGTQGAIETNIFQRRMRRWQYGNDARGMTSAVVEDLTWEPDEDQAYVHNTTDQALDVIQRVAHGDAPYTNPRDSFETMRVVFAAEQSADTSHPIRLTHENGINHTHPTPPTPNATLAPSLASLHGPR